MLLQPNIVYYLHAVIISYLATLENFTFIENTLANKTGLTLTPALKSA